MTIVLNSTTGISTPPVTVLGDTSGSISIVAPAVAGTNTQTLLAATGTLSPFNSGTAKTAPPTVPQYFEFTDIPSWVRRITVMFNGVSLSSTANFLVQMGAGSIETTSYVSTSQSITGGVGGANVSSVAGMIIASGSAASTLSGHIILTLIGSNVWVSSHVGKLTTAASCFGGGDKTLSGTLDRIRITTTTGSDTFDAGTINVLYE